MAQGGPAAAVRSSRGTPLSPVESTAAVTLEGLRILGRVLRGGRVRRDSGRVAAEYDGGYWADVLAQKRWERASTLSEFLVPHDTAIRVAKVDGRFVRIATADYYEYRFATLQKVLAETAWDAASLVEIGCGYGANLFGLLPLQRWRPLVGLDVSPTALEAARRIARHFGCEADLEFEQLDLTNAAAPAFARLSGATVFSYYCFEQLKGMTGSVIDNLIGAGVARVVHIEATPELWSLWNPADAVSRLYTWSQDYQNDLLTIVRDRQARGTLRITEVRRLHYAPSLRHDPTLICWEPSGR
jgi:SAM-dependent methyltransferase